MTEEKDKDVKDQEAVTPESHDQETNNQEEQATDSQAPKEGTKEYNFRRLEDQKREIEARLQQQEELNRKMMELMNGKAPQKQEDEIPELSPDDIPEWKHVQTYAEKIAEKKFQELMAKRERDNLPNVVKQKYSDFDSVVTAERVKKLEQENPALAKAFSMSEDPFSTTYSYFKAMYQEKKPNPIATEEAERLQQSSSRPQSSNAISRQGALKNASAFQKKDKDSLYREMMSYAAQVN